MKNAGRNFDKESNEKKPIKIRQKIKIQNFAFWPLLGLLLFINGNSYIKSDGILPKAYLLRYSIKKTAFKSDLK